MEGTATPPTESSADRSPDSAGARPDLPAPRSDVFEQARVPEAPAEPESRPVRRWALVVLGICAVLFVYHLFADRLTPFTTQASVNAFVVPVSPEVAGLVTEVNVADNHRGAAGGCARPPHAHAQAVGPCRKSRSAAGHGRGTSRSGDRCRSPGRGGRRRGGSKRGEGEGTARSARLRQS